MEIILGSQLNKGGKACWIKKRERDTEEHKKELKTELCKLIEKDYGRQIVRAIKLS